MTNDINEKQNQERCQGCGKHCPIDNLGCRRGRVLLQETPDGFQRERKETGMHGEFVPHERKPEWEERGNGRKHDFRGDGMHRHPSGFDRKYHEEFPPEARGRERPHHDMAEDDSLLGLMHRVMHGLHHSGEWFGGQERVLRLLSEEREVPQFILLDRMHIRPGSLSELVGKLEQKGLVERIQDVEDKRRIILRLTDKGKEAAVKESEKSKDPFAVLSEEEQEQLKTLLKKLLADNA